MKHQVIPLHRRLGPDFAGWRQLAQHVNSQSLTEQEVLGARHFADLSSGHAYHELHAALATLPDEIAMLWREAAEQTPKEWNQRFIAAFCAMSGVHSIAQLPFCRPCPTASNSIELVAAMLRRRRLPTALVEPTFDNLALLLHRREVALHAIDERLIFDDTAIDRLEQHLVSSGAGALFVVSPSNPTGRCLTPSHFVAIAELCTRYGIVLAIDFSFRMYNRDLFDDVALLLRSGTSFIAFEDTGKSFPTLDTKASLIYASPDLANELETLYNEVYLCASGISLLLLSRAFERTQQVGINSVLWSLVDQRRMLLRAALAGSGLYTAPESLHSVIGLEWLTTGSDTLTDIDVCSRLDAMGVAALTGRQFFWASPDQPASQRRIRLSMMKPARRFNAALRVLEKATFHHKTR
ncbi:aminotransferase class I/II-fold pyridoxal phosphate-dependent enzyme [Burkholderia pyrrocinia]|uniref:aminotransferase class I/II-fold pyridoxal phosphate-dependent enzyme n=1 Tax=Burkholderia pyrrocinia TaxID=60550 RepID=UPI001576C716|nr:aminotransferase class I/II-fold pyridoxal phosphate-dependent enzyme [Burkholderia pyrrocinia]NTX26939.1 aminotransferase class I/II-fold pyridoxal phosphate-dependent enzyme [Burkholderia pyrrocinia]